MIVEAAARLSCVADAALALQLAGIAISPRHVGRLAHEIGGQRAQQRDAKAIQHRRRPLPARLAPPPAVVAVEVDGGRLRTRAAARGPGVHQPQNKEDKVACLVSLQSDRHAHDPQPEPPPSFTEPRRVQRLVRPMKGLPGEPPAEAAGPEQTPAPPGPAKKAPSVTASPQRLVGTGVASRHEGRSCGPLGAAEAQERAFYQARRRAFLGDGQAYHWSIQPGYVPDVEPIVDLLHVLCSLDRAAWATGGEEAQPWSLYLAWLRACWQGRVGTVRAERHVWQGRLGKPPPGEELKEHDPRRLVAQAWRYLGNNQERMD